MRSTIPGIAGFFLSFWCFRSFAHDVAAPLWLWVALGIGVIYVCTLTYILLEGVDRLYAAERLNRQMLLEVKRNHTEH